MSAILSNQDIIQLLDDAPAGEGEGLEELVGVSEEVAKAAARYLHKLPDVQRRVVFALRAMYLIGVQHGAEEYRRAIASDKEWPQMPFALDDYYSEWVIEDMEGVGLEYLNKICQPVGLTFDARGGVSLV